MINKWFVNEFGKRVIIIGYHPYRDSFAISAGADDIQWISFRNFMEEFTELTDDL